MVNGWITVTMAIAVNVMLNTIGWIISAAAETDMFYDMLGALAHVLLLLISLVLAEARETRNVVATACVAIWAARLGVHLFTRVVASGGDARLEKYKKDPLMFGVVWFMQALWVFFNTLPIVTIDAFPKHAPWCTLDTLGLLVFIMGFAFEFIADEQKRAFRGIKANRGKFITTGLWKYSRHPNYFGELLLWVGMTMLCSSGIELASWQALVLLAPAFEAYLLLKVSGIPLLERSGKQKWGEDPRYRHYLETTNVLIPGWVGAGAGRR